jgi:DNA-binding CsgD family transcriptional regulator
MQILCLKDGSAVEIQALKSARRTFVTQSVDEAVAAIRSRGATVLAVVARALTDSEGGRLIGARLATGIHLIVCLERHDHAVLPLGDFDIALPWDRRDELPDVLQEWAYRVESPKAVYNSPLTPRDQQIALMIAEGLTNAQIGQRTGLQDQSVRNAVRVILRKLDCENRVQVALKLARSSVTH